LVFSVLSLLTGGGFLVGFILGVVGGVLALSFGVNKEVARVGG
jgi:hypothetical protein